MVECSPRIEDNQWVLDVSADDPSIVGLVGFLDAGKPGFGAHLERFATNDLFRGIRYGNLWGRSLAGQMENPRFLEDMRLLASADLSLDTANPDLELLEAMLELSDRVGTLRMVVDHLPKMHVEPSDRSRYTRILRGFQARPQTFVKLSAVLLERDGRVSHDISEYRDTLDEIWEAFGEDRVLYGSDWPNSDSLGNYGEVIGIVQRYFADKGAAEREKYFRTNSEAAYRWLAR